MTDTTAVPGLPANQTDLGSPIQDENAETRRAVAGNASAPASALEQLAQDDQASVRWLVARNTSTPAPTLAKLSHDDDWSVRDAVSRKSPWTVLAVRCVTVM